LLPGNPHERQKRASQREVEAAFAGWEVIAAEAADTVGLGWPMNKTAPRWYRLRRRQAMAASS